MKKFKEYERYIEEKMQFFSKKFADVIDKDKHDTPIQRRVHEFIRTCKILKRRLKILQERYEEIPVEEVTEMDADIKRFKDDTIPNLILYIKLVGKR